MVKLENLEFIFYNGQYDVFNWRLMCMELEELLQKLSTRKQHLGKL